MERFGSTSQRGFSVRSIFAFVLVVVVTALLWVLIGGQTAHAATAAWSGDTIIYDTLAYNKSSDLKDTSNTIPAGSTLYQTKRIANSDFTSEKVLILYFSPGVDPPTATSAKFVEFTYKDGSLSDPKNQKDVTLTLKGEQSENSSCSVGGIGWIICPVSVFFAEAMDNIFSILAGMISVQPSVLGDPNNSMYTAWNVMRNIANVAFVISFLVIIYSQLTSFGVSNYGIKKLIPRLIVAAVLVNVSFIISAVAIDISNILGYSIQDVFNTIRENIFHITDDNFAGVNNNPWTAVTALILAGGGVIGGVAYLASGGLYLLIPMLLGLLVTIIIVVVVLAARQAIIVILVIIAPIAFVANLLPNTEKWFEKWRDLFMTMLIFFPAFSLVFGGSQLAGAIIIQNAGNNIVMVIFGLAVQVAPLVITPLLLKFSGGLLGKIAQLTNNPSKGLLDRNKKWAENRAEHAKQQNIAKGPRLRNPASWGAKMVQGDDFRKRRLQDKTNVHKQNADNLYHDSDKYKKIHENAFDSEVGKQLVENKGKEHIQTKINTRGDAFHTRNAQLEAGKRALEHTVKLTDADTKEYDAGRVPADANPELAAAIRRMQTARQGATVEGMRSGAADAQIQRELANTLQVSPALRQRAGGIKDLGADSVLASAISAVQKAEADDIKNLQDAAQLKPGDLNGAVSLLKSAIAERNSLKTRAYQNTLLTAGGAGIDSYRKAIIDLDASIPPDMSEIMRENLLSNHGGVKAKGNDLLNWAAKDGLLVNHTRDAKSWADLSDSDFIGQHPKAQGYALDVMAFTKERAEEILAADKVEGNILNKDIKARLKSIK